MSNIVSSVVSQLFGKKEGVILYRPAAMDKQPVKRMKIVSNTNTMPPSGYEPFKGIDVEKWKKRLNAGEEPRVVCGQFAGAAVSEFERAYDTGVYDDLLTSLKAIDRVSRSVAYNSDGIDDGYRLSPSWIRIMIAQLTIDGGRDEGREQASVAKIKNLYEGLGWEDDICINPKFTKTTSTIEMKYDKGDGIVGTLKLVVIPTDKFPAGSVVQSTKTGNKFDVSSKEENGDYRLISHDNGRDYVMTPFMMLRMKVVED